MYGLLSVSCSPVFVKPLCLEGNREECYNQNNMKFCRKIVAYGEGSMRNERKSISLLGWIIGALLLIYLGVFCYLNLCKYAQHVDSDIAAEALLAREIWVEKDITPNDWISSTERRIIGMPTVAAVFYGITGSMQTAAGITCVL